MEEQIKQAVSKLKMQYVLFWVLPVLLIAGYELNVLPVGIYADDGGAQYVLETMGILLTIALIPASLKLFSFILKKQTEGVQFPIALKRYTLWSGIRLGMLGTAVLFNLIVYYLTLGNMGSLCALITFIASFFCLPGEKRLREELDVQEEVL